MASYMQAKEQNVTGGAARVMEPVSNRVSGHFRSPGPPVFRRRRQLASSWFNWNRPVRTGTTSAQAAMSTGACVSAEES